MLAHPISHASVIFPLFPFLQQFNAELSPYVEIGLDAQIPFAVNNKSNDMVNPVWIQVMKL
jgi:hypothetical protein